jgi:hypothetical protein
VQDVNILAINTLQQLTQFVALWDRLQVVHLNLNTSDHIEWTLNTNGDYSTKSAYMVQFHGSINTELDTLIWKSWAPAKCKFSAWLAVQNRLWTADRLARRGWPNQRLCPLRHTTDESLVHLLAHQYSQRVWSAVRTWTEGQFPDPSGWASFESLSIWWRAVRKAEAMSIKAIRSLTILVAWEL